MKSQRDSLIVVYHVAAMGDWLDVINEQLRSCKAAAIGQVHVTFVGLGLEQLLAAGARWGVDLVVVADDANIAHYETLAMLYIQKVARQTELPILYFHTKGVSNSADVAKKRWRRVMQRLVVDAWRTNLDHLTRFMAVGFDWRNTPSNPHFSGTFWMARAEHIRRLPDFATYHGARGLVRYNCEFWIGCVANPQIASLGTTDEDLCVSGYDWDALQRRMDLADPRPRLNLGCNRWYHEGWYNVDSDPLVRADSHEDAATLPSIVAGTVAEIYAGHIAEHIEALGAAFGRWYELLAPGGTCVVCVPDLVGALDLWRRRQHFPGVELPPDEGLMAVVSGFPTLAWIGSRELCMHRRVFDRETLRLSMQAAGFADVSEVDYHPLMVRHSADLGWQVAMQGRKAW